MNESTPTFPCPLCGSEIAVGLARSKKGKPSISLRCPLDARHFRGFIADREYVSKVVEILETDR